MFGVCVCLCLCVWGVCGCESVFVVCVGFVYVRWVCVVCVCVCRVCVVVCVLCVWFLFLCVVFVGWVCLCLCV